MEKKEKKYRKNVAAIVVSSKYPQACEIFIAQRTDIPDAWQFPQGGIDEGESSKEALLRELEEEIGTNDVEVIGKFPDWVYYDFPEKIASKMYPYDGQKQVYYLVRLKQGNTINLETQEPEFNDYKFVSYDEIFDHVTYFKRPIYKHVLKYFKKEGYL